MIDRLSKPMIGQNIVIVADSHTNEPIILTCTVVRVLNNDAIVNVSGSDYIVRPYSGDCSRMTEFAGLHRYKGLYRLPRLGIDSKLVTRCEYFDTLWEAKKYIENTFTRRIKEIQTASSRLGLEEFET